MLAFINAVLYAGQVFVNYYYSLQIGPVSHKHETLITPASYAFAIWGVIYVFFAIFILADAFCPSFSAFSVTEHAGPLRAAVTLTCLCNAAWIVAFSHEFINVATGVLVVLWIALAFIYVNVMVIMKDESFFAYLFCAVPFTLYFAWTCGAVLISIAVSIQDLMKYTFMPLQWNLIMLAILSTIVLSAITFAKDSVFGLVAVWTLVAIYLRDQSGAPAGYASAILAIKSTAFVSSIVIGAMVVLNIIFRLFGGNSDGDNTSEPILSYRGKNYGTA